MCLLALLGLAVFLVDYGSYVSPIEGFGEEASAPLVPLGPRLVHLSPRTREMNSMHRRHLLVECLLTSQLQGCDAGRLGYHRCISITDAS